MQAAVREHFSPDSLMNVQAGGEALPRPISSHQEAASGMSREDAPVSGNSPIPDRRYTAHMDAMPVERASVGSGVSAPSAAGVVQGYFVYKKHRMAESDLDAIHQYLYSDSSSETKGRDMFMRWRKDGSKHSITDFLRRVMVRTSVTAILNQLDGDDSAVSSAAAAPKIDITDADSDSDSGLAYGKAPSSLNKRQKQRRQRAMDPYGPSPTRKSARKPRPSALMLARASALRRHGLSFGPAINNRYGGTSMSVQLGPFASESVPGGQSGSAPDPKLCRQVEYEIRNGGSFVRGHLLNEKLGGSGDDIRNLTPLSGAANHAHSTLENILKTQLNAAYNEIETETRQHRDIYKATVIQYDVQVVRDPNNRPIGIIARAEKLTRRFKIQNDAAIFNDEIDNNELLFFQKILNDGTVEDLKDND